jgi:hypothetical protein
MKPVFADTSYYAAVLSPRDVAHYAASRCSRAISGQVVTTEFVLMELGNGLSGTPRRKAFAAFVAHLRTSPDTIIVPASSELFLAGLDLFAHRADKDWSLTDCTSFVVMTQRGLTEALTADHHFEQAGFKVLLK